MRRSGPLATSSLAALSIAAACGGTDFVKTEYEAQSLDRSRAWLESTAVEPAPSAGVAQPTGQRRAETFRNTYYDFPSEGTGGKRDAKIFDASCKAIAEVTKDFHDKVCLQGSGKLASGATISFAKRDCACAAECPKSGQKICFEALDPKQFPSGRGAMGQAVTPLRTLAVDDKVLPLGSIVYIPEFEGLPRPDGTAHDGCFVAEDRGSKVEGFHVDIFTGDPSTTKVWNQLVPSNNGVHLEVDSTRCAHVKGPTREQPRDVVNQVGKAKDPPKKEEPKKDEPKKAEPKKTEPKKTEAKKDPAPKPAPKRGP